MRSPHTSWRGERVIEPIWTFGQDTGVTPLLFTRSAMEFLMTTESQDLGLTSHPKDGAFYSIVSLSLYWGVRTHTDRRAPPAGLTNTSSSSNLVFPGGLPSRYWPGSTLLSFSGQPVLGCRVIWLPCWLCNIRYYIVFRPLKCINKTKMNAFLMHYFT